MEHVEYISYIEKMKHAHVVHMMQPFPDMSVLQVFLSVNGFGVVLCLPALGFLNSSIWCRDLREASYVTQPEPKLNKISEVSDDSRVLRQH